MTDEELWQAYAWPPNCLRVNFVVSLDGHIRGPNGLSAPLSSPEDRRVFHMLRAGCDAILVGAGTMRDEGYGPVNIKPEWQALRGDKPAPALIAVSASGNVPDIPGLQVVDTEGIPRLKQQYPRILCEGGPTLFGWLLRMGLVDQIALSISGQIGGSGSLLPESVQSHATPIHAHTADDTVFTVWDLT